MSFTVVCSACGARFALSDDLYERKFKDRLVTVRCKHCSANISVDGIELASGPQHDPPLPSEAVAEVPLDMTPTVPLPEAATEWTVSFNYDDDRELDRAQIARALEQGEIAGDTIVWREGMEDWLPIAEVAALADLLPRNDTTGGFLGTGMQLDAGGGKLKKKRSPPPHPAKRNSSRPPPARRSAPLGEPSTGTTAGKARALSAGTLFVAKKPEPAEPAPVSVDAEPVSVEAESIDDQHEPRARGDEPTKPRLPTPPKAPVPAWKANLRAPPPPSDDDEPPSSGTPALRDLMTAQKTADDKPERRDEDMFGIPEGAGGLLAPPAFDLGPPTIDVESPEPPPAVAEDSEVEVESGPAPAPEAEARPQAGSGSGRTLAGLLLVGGATAFCVWWFGFKAPRSSAAPSTTTGAPTETAPAPAPKPESAQDEPAPEQTPSAEPPASSANAAATQANAASAAPTTPTEHAISGPATPTAPPHASPHNTEPTATAKPSSEPAAPTATASAKPDKPLPPFNRSAAIAALSSAAASASACRKQGDPSGMARVVITFAPSGRVTTARVNGPPFAGTPTGGCIASRMRGAHVPPFSGDFVTVRKTVVIH